jgi:hypothetical protein
LKAGCIYFIILPKIGQFLVTYGENFAVSAEKCCQKFAPSPNFAQVGAEFRDIAFAPGRA